MTCIDSIYVIQHYTECFVIMGRGATIINLVLRKQLTIGRWVLKGYNNLQCNVMVAGREKKRVNLNEKVNLNSKTSVAGGCRYTLPLIYNIYLCVYILNICRYIVYIIGIRGHVPTRTTQTECTAMHTIQ